LRVVKLLVLLLDLELLELIESRELVKEERIKKEVRRCVICKWRRI